MRRNSKRFETWKRLFAVLIACMMLFSNVSGTVTALEDTDVVMTEDQYSEEAEQAVDTAPEEAEEASETVEELPFEEEVQQEETADEDPAETSSIEEEIPEEEAPAEETPVEEVPAEEETQEEAIDNETDPDEVEDVSDESMADPWEEKVFNGSANRVVVHVEAPQGAFPAGTTMKVETVDSEDVVEAVETALGSEDVNFKAVDITFYCNGEEIQPQKEVKVKLTTTAFQSEQNLAVVHVEDPESNKAEVMELDEKKSDDTTAVFKTDGFSIYVVVEGVDPDARLNVNFYSADGQTLIAAMSMTKNQIDAGQMNTNIYDPGITLEAGEVFKGWTENEDYDIADAETGLDIADIRDKVTALLNAGSVSDGDELNFYAMIFKSYHISYRDELGVTIYTDEVLYKEGSTNIPYTVQFTYTPYYVTGSDEDDETKAANFDGWAVVDLSTDPETLGDVYQNGESINMAESGLPIKDSTLTLLAQVAYGHWLVFNENGSGAKYTPPLFVGTDKTPATAGMPEAPTRTGYTFGGWYTEPECTNSFDTSLPITETTNVWAKWNEVGTTSFKVLLWKENLSGGYDFVQSMVIDNAATGANMAGFIQGSVGDSTIRINGQNTFIPMSDTDNSACAGFMYEKNDGNNDGKVAANGTSVLNVYFNRRTYTLKFYYGARNNNNQWQIAHNNNSSDYTWGAPSGFTPDYTGSLAKGTDTTGDGKVRGTYYYAAITAKYGADISADWPKYEDFAQGNSGQNYFNSWILMPGAKARTGQYGGNITVKGKITIMDEQVLGNLTSSTGNYLVAQYNNQPNSYTYFIYFKGYDGSGTRTYQGNTYGLYERVTVRSGSEYANQHAPSYRGYTNVGSQNNGVTGRTGREIYYFYDPITYPILFMDGVYINGDGDILKNNNTNTLDSLQGDNAIVYGADVSEYNDYKPYDKISDGDNYVFLGWYTDDQCTDGKEYTFDKMPAGSVKVYAKWILKEYKVSLHPRENGDPSFKYINGKPVGEYGTYGDTFYVNNGEKVGNVGGSRDLYDLIGWFANENLTKVWDFDAFKLNDTIVGKYGELYALDGTDSRYDPEYPGTVGEINLYANWRKILEGADGINVVYTAEGEDGDGNPVSGTDAPNDPNKYSDQAQAIARPAAKAPTAGAGEEQLAFQYWVVQKWNGSAYEDTDQKVFPGDRFRVNFDDAQMSDVVYEEDGTTIKSATYTIQLRAQYASAEDATPTHIYWYDNYTDSEEGILRKDDDLAINQTVTILQAPERTGYEFLGWAKEPETNQDKTETYYTYPDLGEDDLFLTYDSESEEYTYTTTGGSTKTATGVFADENTPYDGMYAVWAAKDVTYTVEYYYMNEDGTYPTTATSSDDTRTAKTDSEVSVTNADKTPNDTNKYALDEEKDDDWTAIVAGDGSTVLKVYFKLNKAGYTIHHYLYNTTTKVAEDQTDNASIGGTVTATAYSANADELYADYKSATFDSFNPTSGSITIVANADQNVIIVYYKLPLTITVEDKEVSYNGAEQKGYGESLNDHITITGLLSSDSLTYNDLKYEVAKGTLVGEYTGRFTADPVVPSYYKVEKTPGKLIITDENVDPSLVVTKKDGEADDYKYAEGETVTFTITVKNIYAVAKNITLSEIEGVTLAQSSFQNVAAGATVTTTATYKIKPADMTAGSFTNTVTATLEGKEYQAEDTVNTETPDAKLKVEKTANPTSGVEAGAKVTYTVKVTNNGNVTVKEITLEDTLVDLEEEAFDLAPGKDKTITYEYTVTQEDVDKGKIDNTVTATGKDPSNKDVTGTAKATVTTVEADAKLKVEKTANPTSGVEAGAKVTYTVKVTNNGNVTVKDIVLEDTLVDLEEAAFDLAPGKDKTITYEYTVTQEDVD
nr:InlB B-repeat-containing protein [Clostridiales bacterium]